MTLDEYFRRNCAYLEEAVQRLSANRDLGAVFAAEKDGTCMFVPGLTGFKKATAIDLFYSFLRAVEADQYAIIIPAWYVDVSPLSPVEMQAAIDVIGREGTGTAYKERRKECYVVIVGDREKTLHATYDIERDYKGKIRRVRRLKHSPEGSWGRLFDLLVEKRTMH